MRTRDDTVTSSRFERRLPGGQHKPAFKLAFGTYGAAARALGVSRMMVWRWCHDQSSLPTPVAETLAGVIQNKVLEVHAAKTTSAILPCRPGHRGRYRAAAQGSIAGEDLSGRPRIRPL